LPRHSPVAAHKKRAAPARALRQPPVPMLQIGGGDTGATAEPFA
jgi:hypothetical protein